MHCFELSASGNRQMDRRRTDRHTAVRWRHNNRQHLTLHIAMWPKNKRIKPSAACILSLETWTLDPAHLCQAFLLKLNITITLPKSILRTVHFGTKPIYIVTAQEKTTPNLHLHHSPMLQQILNKGVVKKPGCVRLQANIKIMLTCMHTGQIPAFSRENHMQ